MQSVEASAFWAAVLAIILVCWSCQLLMRLRISATSYLVYGGCAARGKEVAGACERQVAALWAKCVRISETNNNVVWVCGLSASSKSRAAYTAFVRSNLHNRIIGFAAHYVIDSELNLVIPLHGWPLSFQSRMLFMSQN